jgi:hypothetical protein
MLFLRSFLTLQRKRALLLAILLVALVSDFIVLVALTITFFAVSIGKVFKSLRAILLRANKLRRSGRNFVISCYQKIWL